MIIIDIGACVGEFTDFCLTNYDVTTIYLFEPLQANYDSLVKKYSGNPKVKIYMTAVSNTAGQAKFFKKGYKQKNGEILYDFAGNVGSSLRSDKSNVSKNVFTMVQVVKLSAFIQENNIKKIDIVKIDAEGSEYDIIQDILDNELHQIIDKIYYDVHARKVAGIKPHKKEVVNRIRDLGILGQFYLQSELLHYVPAIKYWSKPAAPIDIVSW
jgi:FkbM family methyltransferase